MCTVENATILQPYYDAVAMLPWLIHQITITAEAWEPLKWKYMEEMHSMRKRQLKKSMPFFKQPWEQSDASTTPFPAQPHIPLGEFT